jgi:hypothetical protein
MRWPGDGMGRSVRGRLAEVGTGGTGHMCRMCIGTLFIPSGCCDVHCWAAQAGAKMSSREGECAVFWEHPGGVHAPARKCLGGGVVHRPMRSAMQWDGPHGIHNAINIVGTNRTRGILDTALGEDCGRKLAR